MRYTVDALLSCASNPLRWHLTGQVVSSANNYRLYSSDGQHLSLRWPGGAGTIFDWGVKIMSATFRGGPLNPARDLGKRCKLPQRGLWGSPSRNRIWCILA